jgi:hypothetical protein
MRIKCEVVNRMIRHPRHKYDPKDDFLSLDFVRQ